MIGSRWHGFAVPPAPALSIALSKDQHRFLELLNSNPKPHWFGWHQPGRDGKLVAAHGHPSTWTHFLASTRTATAIIPKGELDSLVSAGLVSRCRITTAGRTAIGDAA